MITTSQNQSQPKSSSKNTLPCNPANIENWWTPTIINTEMRQYGCSGCELGCQPNFIAPVVFRGNPTKKKMIIGEAPGFYEDKQGLPFTGPAGQLMDKIWASVGWNTNEDWYLGNVVKCRPVAPPGSGKQNLTPTTQHRKKCRPYIEQEIRAIKPHTVVLVGASAAKSILNRTDITMKKSAGRVYVSKEFPEVGFFVMYHPAYLLHSQNYPDKYMEVRKKMWEDIQLLRKLVDERE